MTETLNDDASGMEEGAPKRAIIQKENKKT